MGKLSNNGNNGHFSIAEHVENIILDAIASMHDMPNISNVLMELRERGHYNIASDIEKSHSLLKNEKILKAMAERCNYVLDRTPDAKLFRSINKAGWVSSFPADVRMRISERVNDKIISAISTMTRLPSAKNICIALNNEGI